MRRRCACLRKSEHASCVAVVSIKAQATDRHDGLDDETELCSICALKDMEHSARTIGCSIADSLPDGAVFALVLANVGEGGNMTYLSNANRNDCIALLRELVGKLETEQAKTS